MGDNNIEHSYDDIMNELNDNLKFDKGKLEWTLLNFKSFEGMIKVLELGKEKYSEKSWMNLKDGKKRYLNALMRHLTAYIDGEELDSESGLSHLYHAQANLMFITYFMEKEKEKIFYGNNNKKKENRK